jgi:ABC-type phosphate transport system substrate-binding protein
MRARRTIRGLATTAVAATLVAATAGAALADPDDTTLQPGAAADLIGVGSDTTQGVVKLVADTYNATGPASKIVSWSATGGGTIPLPDGSSIARPVGSGAGKTLLYGASNNANIDFARSSSPQSTAESNAGLQSFPFAVDSLIMVKSGGVASNAPASLTIQQILDIYKGTVTTWNQVGGTSTATIAPKIPQSGSGTRSFFLTQLQAANNNNPVTLGGNVTEVTEHDPAPIQGDPNALAPFSLAKKSTLANPAAVTTEPGFQSDRAVYNVVRGANAGDANVLAAFGENGFFCSDKATAAIEAAGFRQLSRPTSGGACGAPTQLSITNLATSIVATSTAVTVSSKSASQAQVVAKVSAGSAPSGRVSFFEGATQVAANVPLISGQATITPAAAPGSHTYRAVFTPAANSSFQGSEGSGTGTVQKATSSVKADFPGKVKFGKKAKGTVTVALTGSTSKAAGTVTVKDGSKVVGTGTLSGGTVKITLKKLKPGKHTLTVTYEGDANATGSSTTVKVKALPKPKKGKGGKK